MGETGVWGLAVYLIDREKRGNGFVKSVWLGALA